MSGSWNGGSGDWKTPTSWSGGAAPNGQTDQATIAAPGTYDVAISGTETFTVAAATLDNATATLTLAVGAALLLAGNNAQLSLSAGTLDLAGMLVGGTLAPAGGTVIYDGGTLRDVTVDGVLDLSAVGDSLTIAGSLAVDAPLAGPASLLIGAASTLEFANDATLVNEVLAIGAAGSGAASRIGLGGSFVVGTTGTVMIAGVQDDIVFTNSSTAAAAHGFDNQGLFAIGDGQSHVALDVSGFANEGTVLIGTGDVLALTYTAGFFANTGSIAIAAGGTLDLLANVSAAALGAITENGGTLWLAGTYANAGQVLTLTAGGPFGDAALAPGGKIAGGTVVPGSGTLAFAGGTLDGVGWGGATLSVAAGQALAVADGLTFTQPGATLQNLGSITVVKGNALALNAGTALVNDGVLLLEASTLVTSGSLAGLGSVSIGQNGTLIIGAAAAGAVVDFFDPVVQPNDTGTLVITGTSFGGLIEGFSDSDYVIDFAGVTATSLGFDSTHGLLSLFEGTTTVATIEIAGVDVAPLFNLAPDGRGGVLITGPETRSFSGGNGDWYTASSWTTTPSFYAHGTPIAGDLVEIGSGAVTITAADVAANGTLDHEIIALSSATLAAIGESFGAGVTLLASGAASLALTGTTGFAGTLEPGGGL